MFCTSLKSVAVLEEIDTDLQRASKAAKMKSSASHDSIHQTSSNVSSRVKNFRNFISSSPLRRRRALSHSIDSGLDTSGCGVFGVPLVDLVTFESSDIPRLIRRVIEHVEEHGLSEEGLYRINGSARTIDKLKASFNSIGDADFTNVDVASIAGLLKLFLRELPTALIPSDIESRLVDIQQKHPGDVSGEVLSLLKDCLSQLPSVNLAVLKYLIRHLHNVAQHSDTNKMTAVSLSIVFGPSVFHCGGGLEGMREQGYANSVLCRFIMYTNTLFQLSVPALQRPTKPEPYSEHIRKRERSPSSPASGEGRSFTECSVDEAIDQSNDSLNATFSPPRLQVSPAPPTIPLSPSSPPTTSDEVFLRRAPVKKGKRSPKIRSWSADYAESSTKANSSTYTDDDQLPSPPSTMKEEESGHGGLSPFSNHASSLSPPASPSPSSSSPTLTPRSSKVINAVIEGSVKKYLFGPPSSQQPSPPNNKVPTDVYGLLLPNQCDSPTAKRKKPHPSKSRDDHMTTSDVTTINPDPGVGISERSGQGRKGERRPEKRERRRSDGGTRNRQSVVVGGDVTEGDTEVQVLSRSPESKGEGSDVMVIESGRVSDLVHQFDESDGPSQAVSESREAPRKKKMTSKQFDMFERTGLIMSMPKPQSGGGVASHLSPSLSTSPPSPPSPTSSQSHTSPLIPPHLEPHETQLAHTMGKQATTQRAVSAPVPLSPTRSPSNHPLSNTVTDPSTTTTHHHHEVYPHGRRNPLSPSSSPSDDNLPSNMVLGPPDATTQRHSRMNPLFPPSSSSCDDQPSNTTHHQPPSVCDASESADQVVEVNRSSTRRGHRPEEQSDALQHMTKSRPKGPANRRLPTKASSTVTQGSPHQGQEEEEIEYQREEEGRARGEGQKRGHLEVKEGGRHKKSPRRGRKKKRLETETDSSKHHTQRLQRHHLTAEVAPEENTSTAAVRGWIEEEEEKETELDKTEYSSLTQSRPELAVPSAVPVPPAITRTQPEKSLHTKKQASEKTAVAVTENSKTSVCEEAGQITQQESQDATESGATRTQPQSERGGQRSKSGLGGQRSKSGVGDQGSRSGEGVGVGSEVTPGLQLTLEKLMSSLARKRSGAGRPDALQDMTPAQLSDEKNAVQRTLLHFEKIHGRPATVADKDVMRPLYDRYREVKRLLSAQSKTQATRTQKPQESSSKQTSTENAAGSQSMGEQTLPSITLLSSGLAHSLPLEPSSGSSHLSHSTLDTAHSFTTTTTSSSSISTAPSIGRVRRGRRTATGRGETGSKSLIELYGLQEAALAEKKRLRQILREFESQFMATHNRAATRDDRLPRQKEYQEYKAIKERLLYLANEINKNTQLQKTL